VSRPRAGERDQLTSTERAKDKRLREIYGGLTLEEQNKQRAKQGNACAMCGRDFSKFTPFQDHEHKCCPRRLKTFCGKCNRGLLCYPCNKFVTGILEKQSINKVLIPPLTLLGKMVEYFEYWNPILTEKGCYDEKPEAKKAVIRRKKKSVR
jgi:hypothetical protein